MPVIRVVALTPAGAELARRLCQTLEEAECWLPATRAAGADQSFDNLAEVFTRAFAEGHSLVCIMAAGIVVRQLAPLLQGKDRDPAVVVVDEEGRFAVSLLSGHLGGANHLARRVAKVLGGTPVITTATDVQGVPAIDLLAVRTGLLIENPAAVKEASMALLSGQPLFLVDPEGYLDAALSEYPHLFRREPDLEAALAANLRPTVYVGPHERPWPAGWLRLRPPCLVAGLGCHRGTPAQEILDFLQETFQRAGLSIFSLKALATVAAKQNEPGLKEAALRLKVELICFPAEELATVQVPHPSASAACHLGTQSVSEAAALKAGQGELLVPKRKSANVTVAVARVISPS